MPHIEARSTETGERLQCSSSDPALISAWLLEALGMLGPSDLAPMQVRCWPLARMIDGEPHRDWPEFDGFPVRLVSSAGSAGLRELSQQLLRSADLMGAPAEDDDTPKAAEHIDDDEPL